MDNVAIFCCLWWVGLNASPAATCLKEDFAPEEWTERRCECNSVTQQYEFVHVLKDVCIVQLAPITSAAFRGPRTRLLPPEPRHPESQIRTTNGTEFGNK
jgi:hypothetical protein